MKSKRGYVNIPMEVIIPDPVKFVAPEIWALIFEKVQSSQFQAGNETGTGCGDLYNCYKTCTTFRNILEASKHIWLFEQIFQFIAIYLTRAEILTCRGVCKPWGLGVDYYLQNREVYLSQAKTHLRKVCHHVQFIDVRTTFSTSSEIYTFLEVMKNHPGNPFPGGALRLAQVINSDTIFWDVRVMELFLRFGSHVHSLQIKYPVGILLSSLQPYLDLELTMNLRVLCIEKEEYDNDQNPNYDDILLPKLPFLESLQFQRRLPRLMIKSFCGIPANIQCFITNQYSQRLKRLRICLADPNAPIQQYCPLYLPNLEELEVTVTSASQLFRVFFDNDWPTMVLRNVTIKINKYAYGVNLSSIVDPQSEIQLGNFLRPLETYAESLNQVVILCNWYKEVSLIDIIPLKSLKSLKSLHIEGFCFFSILILPVLPKTLQYLHVNGIKPNNENPELKYISLDLPNEEVIVETNHLWEMMPKLRELSVRDNYTKHVFFYHRQRKIDFYSSLETSETNNLCATIYYTVMRFLFKFIFLFTLFSILLILFMIYRSELTLAKNVQANLKNVIWDLKYNFRD